MAYLPNSYWNSSQSYYGSGYGGKSAGQEVWYQSQLEQEFQMQVQRAYNELQNAYYKYGVNTELQYYRFSHNGKLYEVNLKRGVKEIESNYYNVHNDYFDTLKYGMKVTSGNTCHVEIDYGYEDKPAVKPMEDRSVKYRKLFWNKYAREEKRPI